MTGFAVFSLGFAPTDEHIRTNLLAFKMAWRCMHEQLVSTEDWLVAKYPFGTIPIRHPPLRRALPNCFC